MSLLQAGVSNSRGSFDEWEGPPANLSSDVRLAGEPGPGARPQPRQLLRRLSVLLESGSRLLHVRYDKFSRDLEESTLASTYFVAAFILLSLAGFALLLFPEVVLYHRAAHGAIHGCSPSGAHFPGLKLASGDPLQPQLPMGTWPSVQLLPELVVPEDSFCTMVVPVRPLRFGPFDVTSIDGTVLLRVMPHAEVSTGLQWSAAGKMYRQLLSVTTMQGKAVVHCDEANTPRGQPAEFQLLSADSGATASLAFGRAENQYVLSMPGSGSFCLSGSADFSAINVSDCVGKRIAAAKMCKCKFDPEGEYCCIRVEPGADAGAILCALLCINHVGDDGL